MENSIEGFKVVDNGKKTKGSIRFPVKKENKKRGKIQYKDEAMQKVSKNNTH